MNQIRTLYRIALDAFYAFLDDDGWAIASHIALATLMAMFPFLILITSLAGFVGSHEIADRAVEIMFDTWPSQVADSLSGEIHNVLTRTNGSALTAGLLLSVYFASNGIESLRVAVNRAYGVTETRPWYWLRLESIGYTIIAALSALAIGFLIVLGPLIIVTARRVLPGLVADNPSLLDVARYGTAIGALILTLFMLHVWLPAGRRSFADIWPGIVFTVLASLISGILFGQYLSRFANNYVTTYAGLASVIIALVFMYFIAAIFVYGGELNAAIIKSRQPSQPSIAPERASAETPA